MVKPSLTQNQAHTTRAACKLPRASGLATSCPPPDLAAKVRQTLVIHPSSHFCLCRKATAWPMSTSSIGGRVGACLCLCSSVWVIQAACLDWRIAGCFVISSNSLIWCCTRFCHVCGLDWAMDLVAKGFGTMSLSHPSSPSLPHLR